MFLRDLSNKYQLRIKIHTTLAPVFNVQRQINGVVYLRH